MDESIILEDGKFKTEFKLYWSNTYASLMIHCEENGEVYEQFLMDASSVVLREIADQLYEWSNTLEQIEHDNMDKDMAAVKRDREVSDLLKKQGEDEAAAIWDKLPAVLKVGKKKFKRVSAK